LKFFLRKLENAEKWWNGWGDLPERRSNLDIDNNRKDD